MFNKNPYFYFLKTFGCSCFPLLRPYKSHKLDFKSKECLFLGYSQLHNGYKSLSSSGHIFLSKDVLFDEHKFPYYVPSPKTPNFIKDPMSRASILSNYGSTPDVSPKVSNTVTSSSSRLESPLAPLLNTHSTQTRSEFDIFQNRVNSSLLLFHSETY